MTKDRLETLRIRRDFLVLLLAECKSQLEENLEALELWIRELTHDIDDADISTAKTSRWFSQ